jgi:hypothetical protein
MFIRGLKFLRRAMGSTQYISANLCGYKSPKVNLGQIQVRINLQRDDVKLLADVEFQVFSQFGDDGIIQYLVSKLDIPNKTFIEFGVENYTEANTRFLLVNNNWKGLVIDGSQNNIDYIKNDQLSTLFLLYSKCAFITKDNINDLIAEMNFEPDLGLLSVDIDGNDYWVWKAIDVVKPVIVVSEYNADFGTDNAWTIPYKADFVIGKEQPINYWGVSLLSLCDLAEEKGYSFVGCNSQGNNAYFVRDDKLGSLRKLNCKDGYSTAKFFMARDSQGNRLDLQARYANIVGLPIYNTRSQQLEVIS